MSRPDYADAVPPGALPTRRGAGPALAPRNWPVACRLIVVVAIPVVLGLAITGLRVSGAVRSAEAYGQVGQLAVLGQQVTGLAQAVEQERTDTAAFIAAGRPASHLPALHRQYLITDRWAARVRRLVLRLGPGYPPRTRASAATVLASIAELPGLRSRAVQGQAPLLAVIGGYSTATAGLFPVNDGIADLSGSSALTTTVRALGSLSRMKDQASLQQAILGAALAEGHLRPGALTALTVAQAQQASDLASFRSSATPEASWALSVTLARLLPGQAQTLEQPATVASDAALGASAHLSQQWWARMSSTVSWMRDVDQQLAAWITVNAQALEHSAMRSAMLTGGAALAALVLVLLVTLIIARPLLRPLHWLEAAAVDAAGATLPAAFHALGMAGDPGHPLLVPADVPSTAGHETSHRRAEPVTLADVLDAAVSEIEHYDRVILNIEQGVWVSASAAADTAHLLTELLDNATTFSPEPARVIVTGHTARGDGALVTITDGGTGMPGEQLRQLNWQLAHPGPEDLTAAPHMGLLAVAQLAARHGIRVTLGLWPGGGTTAEVHLPAALISPGAQPSGWQGPTGDTGGAWAGEAAVAAAAAAEPQPSALWFAARPEFAWETGIATPDPVSLPLGAPLPSPPPAASSTVTEPEATAAEQGGALPIFESVESDYFHSHGHGLLRPSEPQASHPAQAGQPGTATAPPAS